MSVPSMNKSYIFKEGNAGTSKQNKPFNMVELHDPETLENTKFFVKPEISLDSSKFNRHDKVTAHLAMGIYNGRPNLELVGLTKL